MWRAVEVEISLNKDRFTGAILGWVRCKKIGNQPQFPTGISLCILAQIPISFSY